MSILWIYPREGAMPVIVDGHLHAERAETGQQLEHLGDNQLKGEKHPGVAEVRLLTSSHLRVVAGAFARDPRRAWLGGDGY